MTTAERIAAEYDNDGQCWIKNDVRIDEACSAAGGSRVYDTTQSDVYRWDFRDGSSLTMAGAGWDLGYPACFCWRGAGHVDCDRTEE